jgi:hypothetical protein
MANPTQPLPGNEYPEKDIDVYAHKIVKLLQNQVVRFYNSKGKKQLRQIHPKMNGCVKAEFIVDKDIPEKMRVGLFKEATSYPTWVRFSNGNPKPLPDWKKDLRGVAIKIMNVPGEKLIESKGTDGNQDFILMNTKSFVSKRLKSFYQILVVVTQPPFKGPFLKKIGYIFANLPILNRANKGKININHPFAIPYFSTVPFRFGDEITAVKYAVIPSSKNILKFTDDKNDDFLRQNMAATLMKHPIEYDFCIQFQEDPVKMPIEDPTIDWNSPMHKVATIRIPTQVFDTPERNEFGDNLSFNSWHALPEHRPIGSFNRARKIIYTEMYTFRHEHNHIKNVEPSAGSDFYDDTNIV